MSFLSKINDANGNPIQSGGYYELDGNVYSVHEGRRIQGGVWLCSSCFGGDRDFTLDEIDGKLIPANEKQIDYFEKFRNGLMANFKKYGCD